MSMADVDFTSVERIVVLPWLFGTRSLIINPVSWIMLCQDLTEDLTVGNGKTSSTASIVEDIRKCLRLAILQPQPQPQQLGQASTSIFMMTDIRPKRPRTLWLGRDASTQPETTRALPVLNTDETPKPIPFVRNRDSLTDLNCYEEDPWSEYEPRARIHRKQPITLAQHRTHRHQIVHIRCLPIERSHIQNLLETIGRLSHPRFPRLRESYYHMGELHLVWEPAEITVNYILTARWPVHETELACILRSTLDGIRFLRDQGRVLATLEAETILVDRRGHVRLAGVEQSYQLPASDINAETLKLTALAAIMKRLMATGAPQGRWSSTARAFLEHLTTQSLDEVMQDPFLETATDERELRLCVHVVKKKAQNDLVLL